ncbi:hypothetical protein HELRODRAFT_90150, partial [Helobdella robusta]|uniref:Peptidylglycine monooxygenase n=1 Tax=Helobdella robusta TaxID=6412 RepID=T1G7L7_HELRO
MAIGLFFNYGCKNICFILTFTIFILLLIIASPLTSSSTPDDGSQPTSWVHTIQMPNVTTDKEDKYLCIDYDFSIKSKHFLTGFEAKPDNPNVHHMLLFACSGKARSSKAFECLGGCFLERIYFAWGRNAPPTNLPKGVGFKLATDGIDFLRYQVHYKTIVNTSDQSSLKLTFTTDPQPYTAAVLLMLKNFLKIPAHTKLTIGNVSCRYNLQATMYPIAFRVHAHMLGRVISAYVKKSSGWKLIGKGNPQWPQAFWPTNDKELVIENGDFIAAKCVYNSEHYDVDVNIGSTHNDEMCNFYLMYYKNSSDSGEVNFCDKDEYTDISRDVPGFALEELPPNPDLEDVGEGHKHHHHHVQSNISTEAQLNISLKPASNWPMLTNGMELGEVTGLATDRFGFMYLFHRGSTKWMSNSFDENFIYTGRDQPPIEDNTILKVNISSGEVVKMFGKNIFYMPHGIFVDHEGAIWLTDVAMHNVFKFPTTLEDNPQASPSLILGEKFIPGLDNVHFCKPTDVVVAPTGEVYVSDGYCNSRVIAFDRFGNFLKVWRVGEDENTYYLPHSISMDTQTGTIFVASRSSHSLYIYSVAGDFKKKITSDDFIPELFSVAY